MAGRIRDEDIAVVRERARIEEIVGEYLTLKATAPIERLDRPSDIASAVETLDHASSASPLGGGTDLLPARSQGLGGASVLVDLTGVSALRTVEVDDGDLLLGAAMTLAEVERMASRYDLAVLAETVATIASAQIREVATIGGNLCQQKRCWFFRNGFDCYKRSGPTCPCYAVEGDHRFHHAVIGAHRCQAVTPSDLATTMLALDAVVLIEGPAGRRERSIDAFYTGPGEADLVAGEIVTGIRVPAASREARHAFEKLALWHGDFAIAATGVSLWLDKRGERIRSARVALGGVAPKPWRAHAVERQLTGLSVSSELLRGAARAWVRDAHPLRSNAWKVDAAAGLVERALLRAAGISEPTS